MTSVNAELFHREQDQAKMKCPRCGAAQDDFDGFGVSYCEHCDYCAHFSGTGDPKTGEIRCDVCEEVIEER